MRRVITHEARATEKGHRAPTCRAEFVLRGRGEQFRNAGLTLLELVIYIGVLTVAAGVLVGMVTASASAMTESDSFHRAAERNRTAVLRIESEIRRSIAASAEISTDGRTVRVTLPAGFDAAGVVPGPRVSLSFETSRGEVLNGLDDNQNGLIDDGDLVSRNFVTGDQVPIASAIDVANSNFSIVGDGVKVTLSTFARMRNGPPYVVARSLTVYPRN